MTNDAKQPAPAAGPSAVEQVSLNVLPTKRERIMQVISEMGFDASDTFTKLVATAIAMVEAHDELTAECSVLAAGQCIVKDGLLMGEGGHAYCSVKEELDRLRAENEKIRDALAGQDYASLPSDYPTVRMAHTIRAERDKYLHQVRDTCQRAERAEAALRGGMVVPDAVATALKAWTGAEPSQSVLAREVEKWGKECGIEAALAAAKEEKSNG